MDMITPDPNKAIAFLSELDPHRVYRVDWTAEQLQACGFSVEIMTKENGLVVNGIRVEERMPERGTPGIYSLDLLGAAFQIFTKEPPRSEMQGRGFWYRDVLQQLKLRLGRSID